MADLGLRFVLTCVLGAGAGFLLDRKLELLGRFPVLTLIGFFLGLIAAMVALIREMARLDRQKTDGQPGSGRDR